MTARFLLKSNSPGKCPLGPTYLRQQILINVPVDIQNVGNGKYLYSIDLKLKLIPSVIQDIVKFKWLPDADDYTTGKSISEIIIDLRHEFLCKIYNTADFLYLDLPLFARIERV